MIDPDLRSPEFQRTQRNPGIDALRGVSILLVIIHHIAIRIPLTRTPLSEVLPSWLIGAIDARGYEAVFISS